MNQNQPQIQQPSSTSSTQFHQSSTIHPSPLQVNKKDAEIILQGVIAQLCLEEGVQFINEQSIQLLTQLLQQNLQDVAKSAKSITIASNRTTTNTIDMIYALNEHGVKMDEVSNYIANHPSIPPIPSPMTPTQHLLHPQPQNNVEFSTQQFNVYSTTDTNTNPPHIPPFFPSPPSGAENTVTNIITQRHTDVKRQNIGK